MRIISGKFKNKTILLPTDKNTRPLRDMVKESIFNILKHSNLFQNEISNSSILDLYSGSVLLDLNAYQEGHRKLFFVKTIYLRIKF